MYKVISKYNKFFSIVLKIGFSLLAIWFLIQNYNLTNVFFTLFSDLTITVFIILFAFSFLNWFFEIKKWQYLVSNVKLINFKEACKQSFISFSISLLTPNRVGEYGAKVLFYKKNESKKIFSLSLIGTMSQLVTTLIFGVLSLIFITNHIKKTITEQNHIKIYILLFGFIIAVLMYVNWIKKRKKLLLFNKNIWLQSLTYSGIRYVLFSTQFLLLLINFNIEMSIFWMMIGIFTTYFISALIPMLSLFDWAVKGSVAVWIFSTFNISEEILIKIVSLMWIFNFFIPFLIGWVYIWKQKFKFAL